MTTTNNGRPLPWHDTARCDDENCRGPMIPVEEMANGHQGPEDARIACAACGEGRMGTPADYARTMRAAKALRMLDEGTIHDNKGCLGCNGPLPLDRFRLCAGCVAKDNAERQATLL